MNRSFITKWPERMGGLHNEPTNFVEKLWQCWSKPPMTYESFDNWMDTLIQQNAIDFDYLNHAFGDDDLGKLHTMRVNKSKQIKAGVEFQPTIWGGKPYHSSPIHIGPKVRVISTQEILIENSKSNPPIFRIKIDGEVWYEGDRFSRSQPIKLHHMAINDGFNSVEAFLKWFNKDWKGDIIHWTNHKY